LNEKGRKKEELIRHLKQLNPEKLGISPYAQIYLSKHLQSIDYSVHLAWQIIELGLNACDQSIEDLGFIEIGGGTGILSLTAKWVGFGKVVYSDTFRPSCDDFNIISSALHLLPDSIICGSIDELSSVEMTNGLIASRDVIEHIYDPEAFIKTCIHSFPQAVMVHNTSANGYNIFKKRYFREIQKKDEYEGNPDQIKPGDSLGSFLRLRQDYIAKNFQGFTPKESAVMATLTRGKIYSSIAKDCETYAAHGVWPQGLSHPTNTCDPANGNWTEHLLTLEEYEGFVTGSGFEVDWHFSPYDVWRNKGLKKLVLILLNFIIQNTGLAKYISPAIVMVMKERKGVNSGI